MNLISNLSLLLIILMVILTPKLGYPETSTVQDPNKQGFTLMKASDCYTCHRNDARFTAPSFKDIAARYAKDAPAIIPTLIDKVINGGNRNWGFVRMKPHPKLPIKEAKKMVQSILSLDN